MPKPKRQAAIAQPPHIQPDATPFEIRASASSRVLITEANDSMSL
jgi:hypothetical protein